MIARETDAAAVECLATAGLSAGDVRDWLQAEPGETTDFPADRRKFSTYWQKASRLLGRLPHKPRRSESEHAAARTIQERAREARVRFLRRHGDAVYDALTVRRSRFVRVEDLVIRPRAWFRAWCRRAQEIAAEEGCLQRDKDGLEIDQGLFLSAVLAQRSVRARHLCHAMLLPRPDAEALLPQFAARRRARARHGASVERRGKAAIVTMRNPRFLNAEDETTLDGDRNLRRSRDARSGDRDRGAARRRGRSSEIPGPPRVRRRHQSHPSLSGPIPFVWYLQRDLGYVNKFYRGLALADDAPPDEFGGETIEKPWIAAVEAFAIGGHCQVLLVDGLRARRERRLS